MLVMGQVLSKCGMKEWQGLNHLYSLENVPERARAKVRRKAVGMLEADTVSQSSRSANREEGGYRNN